mgnify:CR=1 FL=1
MSNSDSSINNILKRLVEGSSLAFLSNILTKGLNFAFQILLGRYLGPTTYGWFTVGQSFLSISKSVSLLGLHNSVTKFVSQYYGTDDHEDILGVLSLSVLISGSVSFAISILLVVRPTIVSVLIFNNPDLTQTIRILALLLPVYSLLQISKSFLQAVQYFSWMSISHLSISVFEFLAVLLTIYLGLEYQMLLWLIIIFSLVSLSIGATMVCVVVYRRISWSGINMAPRKTLRFGIPLFFSGIAFTLMSKVDVLLIEYYTLSENVGIYNAALMLSGLISLPLTGLNQAISPMISDLYNRDEINKLISTLQISTRWISMIGLGSGLILFLFSEEIILLWGTDCLAGSIFLSILVIPKAVNAVTGSSGFVLQMTGHQDLSFLNNIVSLIINIALDIILIPRFGPIGAAVGTAIALSLNNILCLIEVYWKVGLPMYDLSILRIFLSTIIVFAIGYMLELLYIDWRSQLVVVFLLYLLFNIILMSDQDKEFLTKVVDRI